jgi:protoporphyrinogen oxidase
MERSDLMESSVLTFDELHNRNVIVLGGGLAGLSYAYGQIRKGNNSIAVLEKDNIIGGIIKPFNYNGFLFDFGPHIFRSKDENVLTFVKNLLHDNYHHISSNPAIFKYGKFFDNVIPVITYKNIENLPEKIRERVKNELNELQNSNKKLNTNNFKECIISQIGETLYWEFFGEYSKKWWGIEPEKLSSDIAPKNLTIGNEKSYAHITTNFEKPTEEIYPTRGGIFQIAKKLEEGIKANGGIILTNTNVKKLEYNEDEITKIIVENNDGEFEIITKGKMVISTIFLTSLCKMLNIECNLLNRGDICVFLKLKGNKMFNFSWIYFHDSDIIFSRIHEPLYYSEYNAPKGFTSLCVEIPSFENDNYWQDNYLGDKVIEQLLDLRIIKPNQEPEILDVVKYPYAYPVYTIDYKENLTKVFHKLKNFKNLKVIGRSGSFSYLNMWEIVRYAIY